MITPNYLKKGDKIGLVASARKIDLDELKDATHFFNHLGLEIVYGKNLFKVDNQFAGTDEERASDFQAMLDDPNIKAIIFARGGYGTIRIVDQINWTKFIESPKWLIGFSDITAIHSHVYTNCKIETIHGIMPLNFGKMTPESKESLKNILFGKPLQYEIKAHPFNKTGEAEAELIGGNLSLIHTLKGSKSDLNTDGKILFLEDLDEYLYHIDRMMLSLKRSGHLNNLAGLIVGGMTEMNDNQIPFGENAYEIIRCTVAEFDYPVCYAFPAGHSLDNRALILGRKIKLSIKDKVIIDFN